MSKYLTPSQFRLADPGIANITSLPDTTLDEYISEAEDAIDAHFGFDLNNNVGFQQHTAWVQSPWHEKERKSRIPNFPVPVQQVLRYRIQVSNISTSGAGFFATIQPGDIMLNVYSWYVEVIPLQSIVWSMAPILLAFGAKPPIVQLDYQAGFYLPVLGEKLTATDTTYTTYRARNAFWATSYTEAVSVQPNTLPPIPPIFYNNGTAISSSTYSLNATEGTVTFNSPYAVSNIITADYTYTIPRAIRSAAKWQTAWFLTIRGVIQMGAWPFDYTRMGDQQVRRKDANTAGEGALCQEALHYLEPYVDTAIA